MVSGGWSGRPPVKGRPRPIKKAHLLEPHYSTFHNYHPPLGFGGGMGKACPAYTGGGWDFYDKQ